MTALNPNADDSSQPGTRIKEVVAASEAATAPEAPAAAAGDPATLVACSWLRSGARTSARAQWRALPLGTPVLRG